MENQHTFQFPSLTIKAVKTLLRKDNNVFAHKIIGTTQNGITLSIYENKGLDLSMYIGDKMECLLEITRGELYNLTDQIVPEDAIKFTYQWQKRIYEFFPGLVQMNEQVNNAADEEEEAMQESFEAHALKILNDWGLNGLEWDVYKARPLLSSSDGFFLLNEYQFEGELEKLELNEEVNIKIDEVFLRGVRHCLSGLEINMKQKIIQSKATVETIPPEKVEVKETKKRRIFFQ